MTDLASDPSVWSWNKVLVFNLGFDRKGPKDVHWIYYPDRARSFYRIGFYDNIFEGARAGSTGPFPPSESVTDRLSLYVELGFAKDAPVDVEAMRSRVLLDLVAEGLVKDHKLVASHSVVMDPAYVHITKQSMAEHARLKRTLNEHGVYPIGRYGGWTYCAIEDNIVEARALVSSFEA
jgi:hypothetical protein